MDQADEELRETIKKLWPLQAKKHIDLLVPPNDCKFILYKSHSQKTGVHKNVPLFFEVYILMHPCSYI